MTKIAHLGAYDTNIGDNIALYNVRKYVEKESNSSIEWTKVELKDFYKCDMDKKYCIERLKEISDNHDMLIIGGGGLIQQRQQNSNKFNLPFYKEVLDVIDIPIMCLSVGFNIFRRLRRDGPAPPTLRQLQRGVHFSECEYMNPIFLENLLLLIDKSVFFSFRNDGSITQLMPHLNEHFKSSSKYKKLPKNIYVAPDPGLIFDEELDRKSSLKKGVLQVAYNGNTQIMNGRLKANILNLAMIGEIRDARDLKVFPHCNKDYRFTHSLQRSGNSLAVNKETENHYRAHPKFERLFYHGTLSEKDYILSEKEFLKNVDYNNFMKIINKYFEYDYSIAMRGHGQMIAMGLNIPHISLSTQPKVYDFGIDNGFKDYTLDVIKDTLPDDVFLEAYTEKLLDMTERLCNDEQYLLNWYTKRDTFIAQCKESFTRMCRLVNKAL
tara:strand:+ start:13502 stop:14812 length:1311 start_codon:yes stop_codon:yes gene_type:complete